MSLKAKKGSFCIIIWIWASQNGISYPQKANEDRLRGQPYREGPVQLVKTHATSGDVARRYFLIHGTNWCYLLQSHVI
jgi:hypothetical protein